MGGNDYVGGFQNLRCVGVSVNMVFSSSGPSVVLSSGCERGGRRGGGWVGLWKPGGVIE